MDSDRKTDIWMPLVIGDYLADTAHLNTTEHGAYLLILMHYWRKGPLPNDLGKVAQIAKLPPDAWSIAQALLTEFFTLQEDGMYHQKRSDREIAKWNGKKLKAKEKASIAARARWNADAPSIPPSSAQAMLDSCPSPSPSPINTSSPQPRKKRVAESGTKHSTDPRHVACKEVIFEYYRSKNNGAAPHGMGRRGRHWACYLMQVPILTPRRCGRCSGTVISQRWFIAKGLECG